MIILKIIICILVGYIFGNISCAYIIGRLNNIDIRSYGSGNAGATNALRTLGKTAGILTYVGDVLKTMIAVLLLSVIFNDLQYSMITLLTGFGVVMGHNYPFWLGFKGGKGIAVTSAIIFLYSPKAAIIYIILFALCVILTKYVSLSSLIVVSVFLLQIIISSAGRINSGICIFMGILFWLSAVFAHRSNIVRLINGTENKIGGKKVE